MVVLRGWYGILRIVFWLLGTCCCRFRCRRRGAKRAPSSIPDHVLDQESESEAELEEQTCQAIRVGVMVGGEMRPLAPDGCQDAISKEPTTTLSEDGEVSDFPKAKEGAYVTVHLCKHHTGQRGIATSAR